MTETLTLILTDMANGGAALGRDAGKRVVFVPYAIPGETVEVEIVTDKGRYAQAELRRVIDPSPDRVSPPCPHFGICSGCHWQHISYTRQLQLKASVVRDQLERIGRLVNPPVHSVWANPRPFRYSKELVLSPTESGAAGLWSALRGQVIPIETCHLAQPALEDLFQEVDIELPGLIRLTLRQGDDDSQLAALAVEEVEPPEIALDFPLSVAIVLPDGTAANLIGDNHLVRRVRDHDFRVSAGVFFYPSPEATEQLVTVVLEQADLTGTETVLEVYAGAGTLTAFLADRAAALVAVEANADAVEDLALNLAETDNVSLYQGLAEDIVPLLAVAPDVVVFDPPASGLPRAVLQAVLALDPERLIYVSSDVATLARDARFLSEGGYRLLQVQPIDMAPQTFHILTVSLWQR